MQASENMNIVKLFFYFCLVITISACDNDSSDNNSPAPPSDTMNLQGSAWADECLYSSRIIFNSGITVIDSYVQDTLHFDGSDYYSTYRFYKDANCTIESQPNHIPQLFKFTFGGLVTTPSGIVGQEIHLTYTYQSPRDVTIVEESSVLAYRDNEKLYMILYSCTDSPNPVDVGCSSFIRDDFDFSIYRELVE